MLDFRLTTAPTQLSNWTGVLGAIRELREHSSLTPRVHFDGSVSCENFDDATKTDVIRQFPTSIPGRAHKLLAALVKRSRNFGDRVLIDFDDFPLAYVPDAKALWPYIDYLIDEKLIREHANTSLGREVIVTASGFQVVSDAKLLPGITAFLCSTCYDLKDCRQELSNHIRSLGCSVRASDDPLNFEVSPTDDSIQSCLLNVERSDVVICLIDKRYGAPLPNGSYEGISATHAEVRFAKSKKIPVQYFIRREAFAEYATLKNDPTFRTKWVEPHDQEQRSRWTEFVREVVNLNLGSGISNWVDQFESSVDLKQMVAAKIKSMQQRRM